jgi:hypothetical protein
MPARPRAFRCPNGHEVTEAAAFCPTCGAAIEGTKPAVDPGVEKQPVRRFAVQLPGGRPSWAGRPGAISPSWAVAAFAIVQLALYSFFAYVQSPRPLFYVAGAAVLIFVLPRLADPRPVTIAAFYIVAMIAAILSFVAVHPAVSASLGYPHPRVLAPKPINILSALGEVTLSVAIVSYFDPHFRDALVQFLRPQPPAIDLLRVGVGVLAVALGAIAVGRLFTGWVGFHVAPTYSQALRDYQQRGGSSSVTGISGVANGDEDAGAQNFPSGYPLPSSVDQALTNQFTGEGLTVDYHHCTYFAPGLGPPPVYNCSFKVNGIWHDNIQGTGHPDGTFSWQDDTSGVAPLG